jgi:hypothetical protein
VKASVGRKQGKWMEVLMEDELLMVAGCARMDYNVT